MSCYREMCKLYRGGDYQKGCDREKEILVTQDDLKKTQQTIHLRLFCKIGRFNLKIVRKNEKPWTFWC